MDAVVVQRLRTEGVAVWQQLKKEQSEVSFTGSYLSHGHYRDRDGEKAEFRVEHDFNVTRYLGHHCALAGRTKPDGRQTVKVVNPDYRFEVDSGGNDSSKWMLSEAGTSPELPSVSTSAFTCNEYAWEVDDSASLVNMVTQSDAFRINEAILVLPASDASEPATVRLRVTNIEDLAKRFNHLDQRGFAGSTYTVVLSPERNWTIDWYEERRRSNGDELTISGEIEYWEKVGEGVFTKLITRKLKRQSTEFDPDEVLTLQIDRPSPVNGTAQFYLSHYGIDDSAIRGDTRGRLWRFGYFVIGVAALVIAWRVLKKRAEAGSA